MNRPKGVPALLAFGLTPDGMLRLDLEKSPGSPLSELLRSPFRVRLSGLGMGLFDHLESWHRSGFIHGDISPRNILISREPTGILGLHFIDFLPDLHCFEGTPDYASKEVHQGRHTFASDRYATQRILSSFALD